MNQREVEEMEARLSALYAEIQSLTDDNAELKQERDVAIAELARVRATLQAD